MMPFNLPFLCCQWGSPYPPLVCETVVTLFLPSPPWNVVKGLHNTSTATHSTKAIFIPQTEKQKKKRETKIRLNEQRLLHLFISPVEFVIAGCHESVQSVMAKYIHSSLSLFLLCFRYQVVWDRYMGVIKSCIFKMYHD